MDKNLLTETVDVGIMGLEEEHYYSARNYAFFGNESGYAKYLIFGEGKAKHLHQDDI